MKLRIMYSPHRNKLQSIWLSAVMLILCSALQGQNFINSLNATCGESTFTSTTFKWDKPAGVDSFHIFDLDSRQIISKQEVNEIGFSDIKAGQEYDLQIIPICKNGCPPGIIADTISCTSTPCPNVNVRIEPKDPNNPNLFFLPGNKIKYCFLNGSGFIDFDSIVTGIPTQEGRWESNGVVSDQGVYDVRGSGFGIFQVRYVIDENPYCSYRDLYTIIVENLPPLDFTYDELICPNTPSLFKIPSYVDPRIVPNWIIEGNGVLENIALDSFAITFDAPGEYLVGMHIDPTINECLSDTVWHTINVRNDLAATVECTPFNDKLELNWEGNACFASYKVIIDGVEVADQPEKTYTVTGLAEGQDVSYEIIPVGPDCSCNIIPTPGMCTTTVCDPFVVDVENETFLCDYPEATLQLTANPQDPSREYTQVWSGVFVTESGLVDMANLPSGENEFRLTTTSGQCNYDTLLYITKTVSPVFEIEYGGPACGGDRGYLDIFLEDMQEDYEIYIDNALVDFQSRYSVGLDAHEVYITDSYGCSGETQYFDLSAFKAVSASFDQRDDVIIQEDQMVDYNVLLSNDNTTIDSIRWYYDDEMICGGGSCERSYSIAPEDSGTLCAELYFDATCTQMICASIRVNKKYDYYIPNIISLNGQTEVNTAFSIFSEDDDMVVNDFRIYDQWGNKVYEKESLEKSKSIGWAGIANGRKVSSGVFVYVGELEFSNGRILKVNGDLTVLNE